MPHAHLRVRKLKSEGGKKKPIDQKGRCSCLLGMHGPRVLSAAAVTSAKEEAGVRKTREQITVCSDGQSGRLPDRAPAPAHRPSCVLCASQWPRSGIVRLVTCGAPEHGRGTSVLKCLRGPHGRNGSIDEPSGGTEVPSLPCTVAPNACRAHVPESCAASEPRGRVEQQNRDTRGARMHNLDFVGTSSSSRMCAVSCNMGRRGGQ
ncbi:hypothetical protein B0T16DRAFT_397412 [Cercophora newfieldiana]|uniref:Uncharacterized protein n=1 Tax=Cercophora newfieldiana TaxID=92897 RepID=A0AA40D043_9PEZI|nr:hypothetical protein B0T16DRAFT_397412 [Cercophora newfieldiana]